MQLCGCSFHSNLKSREKIVLFFWNCCAINQVLATRQATTTLKKNCVVTQNDYTGFKQTMWVRSIYQALQSIANVVSDNIQIPSALQYLCFHGGKYKCIQCPCSCACEQHSALITSLYKWSLSVAWD